jgi:hypothetical protein
MPAIPNHGHPDRAEHKVQMKRQQIIAVFMLESSNKRTRKAWQQIQNLPEKGNTGSGHWKVVATT